MNKTPGGISKHLLTPCRRVGLSRKWRQSGSSPFISPLRDNITQTPTRPVNTDTRTKRKQTSNEDEDDKEDLKTIQDENVDGTPTRRVEPPRKKKSRTIFDSSKSSETISLGKESQKPLSSTFNKTDQTLEPLIYTEDSQSSSRLTSNVCVPDSEIDDQSSTPHVNTTNSSNLTVDFIENTNNQIDTPKVSKLTRKKSSKKRSPNNLAKECMIVIEKKINQFKPETENREKICDLNKHKQTRLSNSDSDDTPLSEIAKSDKSQESSKQSSEETQKTNEDDEDFLQTSKVTIKSLQEKNGSKGDLNKSRKTTKKSDKVLESITEGQPMQASGSSIVVDDDDFVVLPKRTILIKKSYSKLTKAKSTGSITQRDIDELKEKIEAKKNLLMAQIMIKDTAELREGIKKWRRGCQDALEELIVLMKKLFPERHGMDYSELLEMLKIPPNIVGYDVNYDTFKNTNECILDFFINTCK